MSVSSQPVFYFGDSLSDTDVIFDALVQGLTAQILPGLLAALGPNPTPAEIALATQQATALATQQATLELQSQGFGPENAVSNEFTHVVYAEEISGMPSVNYANAGARALGTQEPFGPGTGYDSNLGAQLARFAADIGGMAGPSSAVLFIGSNDFSDILGDAADGSIFDLLGAAGDAIGSLLPALEAAARTLDMLGVDTIYYGTLPPATFFPATDALDSFEAGVADLTLEVYNGLLTGQAETLRADGIDVRMIDYAALAGAITEDPGSFGIVAPRSDLLVDGSPFDSDQVGFWDPIHPAEAAHQAWGAYASLVMAGGSTASLSDFGTLNIQTSDDNAVFANGGDDTVMSLAGDDIVFGGSGDDRLITGGGNDIGSGGSGDDLLRGSRGNDILDGGSGDDTVSGGSGDDVLIDGLGNDLLRGGRGDDVFIYVEGVLEGDASASSDTFRGGAGNDTLYLVLDTTEFESFNLGGAAGVLSSLDISLASIETVIAIDGRAGVEPLLSNEPWFQDADFWGLIPAPTPAPDLLV